MGFCQTVGASAAFAPKQNVLLLMEPRFYAKTLVSDKIQFSCLDALWTHESHWNPKALNKSSGAYGIAQFMPKTWENYKHTKTSDPIKQIHYGLRYISVRYHSPCGAWAHEQRVGWY